MGWRGYIDEPHDTVFFWSQKAACTTLFTFLADNMDPRPEKKNHFHRQSQSGRLCREAIAARGLRSVILARHPVTRAISAYFNKFCVYRGRALQVRADLEPFAQELHDLWCMRRGKTTETNLMAFEDYLDTVAHLHASREKPNAAINGHWETQVPPHLAREISYDHILRVETLDADLSALAAELGMTWRARAMNRTETGDGARAEGYLGQVPAHEVAALNFGMENFVTPVTLARIGQIYAVDFKVLGYPPAPDL